MRKLLVIIPLAIIVLSACQSSYVNVRLVYNREVIAVSAEADDLTAGDSVNLESEYSLSDSSWQDWRLSKKSLMFGDLSSSKLIRYTKGVVVERVLAVPNIKPVRSSIRFR